MFINQSEASNSLRWTGTQDREDLSPNPGHSESSPLSGRRHSDIVLNTSSTSIKKNRKSNKHINSHAPLFSHSDPRGYCKGGWRSQPCTCC